MIVHEYRRFNIPSSFTLKNSIKNCIIIFNTTGSTRSIEDSKRLDQIIVKYTNVPKEKFPVHSTGFVLFCGVYKNIRDIKFKILW